MQFQADVSSKEDQSAHNYRIKLPTARAVLCCAVLYTVAAPVTQLAVSKTETMADGQIKELIDCPQVSGVLVVSLVFRGDC